VGKSSVLRAGVAHRLRELSQENLEEFGSPEFMVIVFSSWRDDPLVGLSNHIRETMKQSLNYPEMNVAISPSFALALKGWAERLGGDLLIILDQFEEYFLYHGQESGKGTFAEEFPRVINRSDLRVNFLISIRDDALAKLDRFKGHIPNLFDNCLRIKHLSKRAAQHAIEDPVKKYNELNRAEPEFTVEDGLVEKVCEEVKIGQVVLGHTGPAPLIGAAERHPEEAQIEAPYLQLVMSRIWDEEVRNNGSRVLRSRTLENLGGAERIVKTHLDHVMQALPPTEQNFAARAFHYLVTPSGTKIAYTANDLSVLTKLPIRELTAVLENLSGSEIRILRTVPSTLDQPAMPRYEIFHDVLGPAIVDWSSRYAQEQEKTNLAREAQLKLEQEQRRARRLTIYLVIAISLSVLLFLLTNYVNRQRSAAKQAQDEALIQKTVAERQKNELQNTLSVIDSIDRSAPYFKAIMRGHKGGVNSAVFSGDGTLIATAGADSTARLWWADSGKKLADLQGHTDVVNSIAFSPDRRLILTASKDKTARLWETEKGQSTAELKEHTGAVNNAAFSPDGRLVVTSSVDGTARIWDVGTGKSLFELKGHTGEVNNAAFSPDNQFVVTASADGTARVWSAQSGQSVAVLREQQEVFTPKVSLGTVISRPPQGVILKAIFSPDGNTVVTANVNGEVRLWNVHTGSSIALLRGHTGAVNDVAFSPDGQLIVTAGDDRVAKVWDVQTKRVRKELKGHKDVVLSAAFSPDGQRVITTSGDRTARVWGVGTGEVQFELRGHTDRVRRADFSPDGNFAVTASGDSTVRVWDLTGETGLRVSEVSLQSNPTDYSGLCPATIRLSGKIILSGGSGQVTYRFVRSNGPPSVSRTLTFDSPGTKDVTSTWRFGGPRNPTPSGTFYLEVLSPQNLKSNEVKFNIKCDLTTEGEVESTSKPLGIFPIDGHVFDSRPREIAFQWSPIPEEFFGEVKYVVTVKLYDSNDKELQTILKNTVGHTISISTGSNWQRGRWKVVALRPSAAVSSSGWWEFNIRK
jgi:WD40 repeat protein